MVKILKNAERTIIILENEEEMTNSCLDLIKKIKAKQRLENEGKFIDGDFKGLTPFEVAQTFGLCGVIKMYEMEFGDEGLQENALMVCREFIRDKLQDLPTREKVTVEQIKESISTYKPFIKTQLKICIKTAGYNSIKELYQNANVDTLKDIYEALFDTLEERCIT